MTMETPPGMTLVTPRGMTLETRTEGQPPIAAATAGRRRRYLSPEMSIAPAN